LPLALAPDLRKRPGSVHQLPTVGLFGAERDSLLQFGEAKPFDFLTLLVRCGNSLSLHSRATILGIFRRALSELISVSVKYTAPLVVFLASFAIQRSVQSLFVRVAYIEIWDSHLQEQI
jgi:hypothetical protein